MKRNKRFSILVLKLLCGESYRGSYSRNLDNLVLDHLQLEINTNEGVGLEL